MRILKVKIKTMCYGTQFVRILKIDYKRYKEERLLKPNSCHGFTRLY